MEIRDDGKLNPIIIISHDEIAEWLRQKADEAGYADRALCAVQTSLENGTMLMNGISGLTLMVSNIKGSRDAGQSPLE